MAEEWDIYGGAAEKPGVYSKQIFALAVVAGTPLLSLALTALRLYAKRQTSLGADDYVICLATALSIVIIYPSWRYIKMWHLGIHIWDINPHLLNPPMDDNYKMTIWFNVCNVCILPLVKASILLLLLKVGGVIDNVRKSIYAVFALNAISCVISAFFLLFQCPVKPGREWEDRTFGNLHCAGLDVIGTICTFQVSVNMFTDLLVFPIPCYLTWRLQKTSFRNRLIVVFLFSLSLVYVLLYFLFGRRSSSQTGINQCGNHRVTAITAAKLYLTYQGRLFSAPVDDWTWGITFTMNHWENCVAIVVACIPSLRALILGWLGKDESAHNASGANGIHIAGGNVVRLGTSHTQSSSRIRENFLARLRPPPKRRGLYDTTVDEQTIDLENCTVKPQFGETITEENPDVGSCSSKTQVNYYTRSENVSTASMDNAVAKPESAKLP
ncbi:hypothetical protein Dda_6850 [Drechslerella dactyloides]|uniref:Rhodopsin domain-containing protein n=1 Tax=Drechslerella dactyloides TaxID=74499 RepID=A0AAD6IYA1_DREDA|nr:hypothetical protein Dda_6850 [Drechslerella dactyloides]